MASQSVKGSNSLGCAKTHESFPQVTISLIAALKKCSGRVNQQMVFNKPRIRNELSVV